MGMTKGIDKWLEKEKKCSDRLDNFHISGKLTRIGVKAVLEHMSRILG